MMMRIGKNGELMIRIGIDEKVISLINNLCMIYGE